MNLTMHTMGSDQSTTGQLEAGTHTFFTIEPPWLDNRPDVSCVPAGTYKLIPYKSPVHGATWCLDNPALNVYGTWPAPPGARTRCEIHSGNFARQSEACILLGLAGDQMFDPTTQVDEPAVEDSRDALAEFVAILTPLSSGHTLEIVRL